ncbi:MAG TPA: transketolase [Firmicutes bacterium]|jgi:transketolase|nr:transketolase [Bacillota bacterium]
MLNTIACRKMFTDTLLELAQKDRNIVVLTTDARGSVTLDKFAEELPEQFIEIGIAEQNSVGIGAGLATCNKKPFVCGPACFLSARSLEQVKVDAAYTHTNVKLIGVSGGVSYGALGTSHHSLHDIAVMRAIPGITIVLPCDVYQTRKMVTALVEYEGPVYVRMGRNAVPNVYLENDVPFKLGVANILMDGRDLTIIGTGETVRLALDAGMLLKEKGIGSKVIDMHTLKPLDEVAILKAAKETGRVITVEEHSVHGGLGAAIAEVLAQNNPVPMKILGVPDEPTVAGTSAEVFKHYGLTAENIARIAKKMLEV